ncbi:hypothetical protein QQS21_012205 [Conoideocrella luteorostrata]|uniref:Uncharacterized protein n=1 Tax=Conoideocrella luteorostrata TaxID=1105319 RepID=A0AAJ0FSN1_9HYPO|nr:hypothetical protein QQS21_012205 [Conoideocrella luteorostrata]
MQPTVDKKRTPAAPSNLKPSNLEPCLSPLDPRLHLAWVPTNPGSIPPANPQTVLHSLLDKLSNSSPKQCLVGSLRSDDISALRLDRSPATSTTRAQVIIAQIHIRESTEAHSNTVPTTPGSRSLAPWG